MHPIGQERTILISPSSWTGDLPSGDPTDWFESPEEYLEVVGYAPDDDDDDELLEEERLIDEY